MRIICLGDAHYSSMRFRSGHTKEINNKFYNKLFSLIFSQDADLYLSLGDLTHFGTLKEFRGIYSIIEETKTKNQEFLQVVGNHDLFRFSKWGYQRLTGMELYHVRETEEAKLIFLDTSRVRHFGKKSGRMHMSQVEWLENELMEAGDKLCVVFAHHPISRIEIVDWDGRLIHNTNLYQSLKKKSGNGVFVNGHLHKDRYEVYEDWAFLQFNDILDEPTIRVLDIEDGSISLDTISCKDEEQLDYSQHIASAILTFRRTRNDEEYASVRKLDVELQDSQLAICDISKIPDPYFSKKERSNVGLKLAGTFAGIR